MNNKGTDISSVEDLMEKRMKEQDSIIDLCFKGNTFDISNSIPATMIYKFENTQNNTSDQTSIAVIEAIAKENKHDKAKVDIGIYIGFLFENIGVKQYSQKEKVVFDSKMSSPLGNWFIVASNGTYFTPNYEGEPIQPIFKTTELTTIDNVNKGWLTFSIPKSLTAYKVVYYMKIPQTLTEIQGNYIIVSVPLQ